jgi:hypothetical protein
MSDIADIKIDVDAHLWLFITFGNPFAIGQILSPTGIELVNTSGSF